MKLSIKKSAPLYLLERAPLIWPFFVVIASLSVGFSTSPYKGAATTAYLLLLIGILHRTRRNVHATLMSAGMLLDLCLVLILEFQRSAIGTASGGHLNFIQASHVTCSTLAVVLYIPVAILGYRRFKDELEGRGKASHKKLGVLAFALRTIGYILMFSMTGNYA